MGSVSGERKGMTTLLRCGDPAGAREQADYIRERADLPQFMRAAALQLQVIAATMSADHAQTVLDADAALVAYAGLTDSRLLPFGLLRDNSSGRHLVQTHEIPIIPSARELLRRQPGPARSDGSAVVIAE